VSWLETYRGTVYRREVDHNDHLAVAYHFARFADAGLGVLEAVGLGDGHMERAARGCGTNDCYVRYQREQRLRHVEISSRRAVAFYAEHRQRAWPQGIAG
jgi:acyl-CoA thioesterase FadM